MTNKEKIGIIKLLNIIRYEHNMNVLIEICIAEDLQSYCHGNLFSLTRGKYKFIKHKNGECLLTNKGKLFLKLMENESD